MNKTFTLPLITMNDNLVSIFSEESYTADDKNNGMFLSENMSAASMCLRKSAPGFSSDWHVADAPAFITIKQGTLRVLLRDDSYIDFSAGDSFVARDILPTGVSFDAQKHGHRSEVIGNVELQSVHIKLAD